MIFIIPTLQRGNAVPDALRPLTKQCVATATIDLTGFSHPKARYFLLLRQKKVSKEKATRLPLESCVPRFRRGLPKGAPAPSSTCGLSAAPLTGCSRRKLRYSARHAGLNSYHRQIFFALTRRLLVSLLPCAALIVIHKYLGNTTIRHPGRDCRDPEAMDGNTKADNKPRNAELIS